MFLTLLLAATFSSSAPAPAAPLAPPAQPGAVWPAFGPDPVAACDSLSPRIATDAAPPRARRLIELPPGRLELTVLRQVDNCPIPVVLREGIGAAPAAAPGAPAR
jgi:hypothetical protein